MVLIYRARPQVETYFDGFKHYLPTLVAFLLVSVIVLVGSVLLIIPGIIAAIGLSQTFYILKTNLNWEPRVPSRSWRMTWTNGHMWKVFFMHFLIFFVTLGGLLALGVGLLHTAPLGSVMAGLVRRVAEWPTAKRP